MHIHISNLRIKILKKIYNHNKRKYIFQINNWVSILQNGIQVKKISQVNDRIFISQQALEHVNYRT